jgi:hypothetical protein
VDLAEADAFFQESRDRDLIGGVEHGGHGAAGGERLVSELERRDP